VLSASIFSGSWGFFRIFFATGVGTGAGAGAEAVLELGAGAGSRCWNWSSRFWSWFYWGSFIFCFRPNYFRLEAKSAHVLFPIEVCDASSYSRRKIEILLSSSTSPYFIFEISDCSPPRSLFCPRTPRWLQSPRLSFLATWPNRNIFSLLT